jgi:hypothetical protein
MEYQPMAYPNEGHVAPPFHQHEQHLQPMFLPTFEETMLEILGSNPGNPGQIEEYGEPEGLPTAAQTAAICEEDIPSKKTLNKGRDTEGVQSLTHYPYHAQLQAIICLRRANSAEKGTVTKEMHPELGLLTQAQLANYKCKFRDDAKYKHNEHGNLFCWSPATEPKDGQAREAAWKLWVPREWLHVALCMVHVEQGHAGRDIMYDRIQELKLATSTGPLTKTLVTKWLKNCPCQGTKSGKRKRTPSSGSPKGQSSRRTTPISRQQTKTPTAGDIFPSSSFAPANTSTSTGAALPAAGVDIASDNAPFSSSGFWTLPATTGIPTSGNTGLFEAATNLGLDGSNLDDFDIDKFDFKNLELMDVNNSAELGATAPNPQPNPHADLNHTGNSSYGGSAVPGAAAYDPFGNTANPTPFTAEPAAFGPTDGYNFNASFAANQTNWGQADPIYGMAQQGADVFLSQPFSESYTQWLDPSLLTGVPM